MVDFAQQQFCRRCLLRVKSVGSTRPVPKPYIRSTPESRPPGSHHGGLLSAKDRDRGEPRGSAPPTPPGIRVRTTAVREVALTRIDQGRETERFEVGIGKS